MTGSDDCCSLGSGELSADQAACYADLFKVLSDPTRLRLLSQIADRHCEPMSVTELTETSGLSQPTVSHHLKLLTEAGLLAKVRVGRTVTHEVQSSVFADLRTVLHME